MFRVTRVKTFTSVIIPYQRLRYDARKYANNCLRRTPPSDVSCSSSSDESTEDTEEEVYMEAYEQCNVTLFSLL